MHVCLSIHMLKIICFRPIKSRNLVSAIQPGISWLNYKKFRNMIKNCNCLSFHMSKKKFFYPSNSMKTRLKINLIFMDLGFSPFGHPDNSPSLFKNPYSQQKVKSSARVPLTEKFSWKDSWLESPSSVLFKWDDCFRSLRSHNGRKGKSIESHVKAR